MSVHNPIPGYWYANPTGQLMQVRAVLYKGTNASRTVLEYINGRRETLSMDDWCRLDLSLHSPGVEQHRHQSQVE